MAYTYGESVTIGNPTKASEQDISYTNEDYLYDLIKVIEAEFGFDGTTKDFYGETTFTGSQLNAVDIWTNVGKLTKLWDFDMTYTGSDLTSLVGVRISPANTITYTMTYTSGLLTTFTKTTT